MILSPHRPGWTWDPDGAEIVNGRVVRSWRRNYLRTGLVLLALAAALALLCYHAPDVWPEEPGTVDVCMVARCRSL